VVVSALGASPTRCSGGRARRLARTKRPRSARSRSFAGARGVWRRRAGQRGPPGSPGGLDAGWRDVATLLRAATLLKAPRPRPPTPSSRTRTREQASWLPPSLKDAGQPAEWVDARRVIVTDARHQQASPLTGETAGRLSRSSADLDRRAIPVLADSSAQTPEGVTSTLGRGGSDYSASLVGACLGAAEIQIWTDVDGMLTADPRIFGRAPRGRSSVLRRSLALARFGAKVLHPSTVRPAVLAAIPCAS